MADNFDIIISKLFQSAVNYDCNDYAMFISREIMATGSKKNYHIELIIQPRVHYAKTYNGIH